MLSMGMDVAKDLHQFYAALDRLAQKPGQGRPLREQPGNGALPVRGVYFFFEHGEARRGIPGTPRVVRVGTHAVSKGSKSILRQRLKAHLGTRAGGGNHRGSIFRLHVGVALLQREKLQLPWWGDGRSAPKALRESANARTEEAAWEQRVSAYIGAMPVLWVDVPGEAGPDSCRALIERNAIALLSNHRAPVDPPSEGWLGHHSERDAICSSGLWNLNSVDGDYDPGFIAVLQKSIDSTCDPD
jgi:hypothetical protein